MTTFSHTPPKFVLLAALLVFSSLAAHSQSAQKAVDAYNSGLELQSRGALSEALAAYDLALKHDPRMLDAYNNRANIKLEMGDGAGALADLTKIIELSDGHPLSYYNRGNLYKDLERSSEAIADYTRAIDILNGLTNKYEKKAHAMSYNNRGNVLTAKGDHKAALADYERSLQIMPNSAEALTGRGAAQQNLGAYAAAVADYTKALEVAPENPLILYNRATANEEIDKAAAVADYTKVLVLQPENAEAFARRGVMLLDLKRKTEAASDLRRAFSLDPGLKADYGRFLSQALDK
jgi:tetratricopeptide (TPR) repeat protein